jgi:PAS domain S-box-containing protein
MKNRAEVEEYLRRAGFLILEAARENIFVSDAEGRIVYFNPAAEETTGYRLPDLIGQNIDVFYEDKGVSARAQEEITMTGRPKAYEAVCLDKAGGRHILSVKKAPLFNETGRLVGFMAVSRDVTRERLHEEELRAIKEFNEAVLNAAEDMITVTGREGMVTYFNPAAERITGYTREQVLGRNVTMFYRDAPAALRKMDEIADQNAPQAYETVIVDRFGQEHIFSIKKAPLYDDDHHLIGFTATSRDITQSRKREGEIQALKEFQPHGRGKAGVQPGGTEKPAYPRNLQGTGLFGPKTGLHPVHRRSQQL